MYIAKQRIFCYTEKKKFFKEDSPMKPRRTVAAAVTAAAAAAGAALLGAAYGIYRISFYHKPDPAVPAPAEMESRLPYRDAMEADAAILDNAPYEEVHITAKDGVDLFGRYYHHKDGAPVALIFHGYTGYAQRDGLGGYILCRKLGYNVLLPDQRAHGRSGGHTITMGAKEQYDAQSWANWAAERFGQNIPLFLMGVSMGAATVMLASGLPLPSSVKGIVADCGYTSAEEITRKCLPNYLPHAPVDAAYAVGRLGARLYGRFEPNNIDCTAAVSKATVPILFIHGEEDDFVPCEMSRKNFDACASRKQLLTIPGAAHAVCYYRDTEKYTAVTTKFFEECLEQ